MRRITNTLLLVCLVVAFFGMSGTALGARVSLQGDKLSLDVQGQPLSVVLDELAKQSIRVRIDPGINPEISASFERRPIGQAIGSILKSVDYVLIWDGGGQDGSTEPKLTEIRIFRPGQSGDNLPMYRSPNLSVTQGRNGARFVENSLLLIHDSRFSDADLAVLLERFGATVVARYAHLGIVHLLLPDGTDIERVAEIVELMPGVRVSEPDYVHELERSIAVRSPEQSSQADEPVGPVGGTTVAVLDSGLAHQYGDSQFIVGLYDAVSPGQSGLDRVGHGTQMALVASGTVVPFGAEGDVSGYTPVVAIRAFDDNGLTSNATLLRGIEYALKKDAKVVSLSWGTSESSVFLDSVMGYAKQKGLVVVAAAGNVPTGNAVYPAALDSVIGVGALSSSGEVWSQSNFGDSVSAYAPGLADMPVGSGGAPGVYAGTSIAAAYASRVFAQVLNQSPDADITILLNRLAQGSH